MNDNIHNSAEQQSTKNNNAKNKRLILIITASLLLCIALLYALTFLLENCSSTSTPGNGAQDAENSNEEIYFYPPDYMTDIRSDENYLSLNRIIRFADKTNGTTISLNDQNIADQSKATLFMYQLVNRVISGDETAYNAMFSKAYYTKVSPKNDFTMQRLYNITITKESETIVSDNGSKYNKYVYSLEYFIQKNDGTYRNDIGSDCSKKQKFTFTDREGELLIDLVSTVVYK